MTITETIVRARVEGLTVSEVLMLLFLRDARVEDILPTDCKLNSQLARSIESNLKLSLPTIVAGLKLLMGKKELLVGV